MPLLKKSSSDLSNKPSISEFQESLAVIGNILTTIFDFTNSSGDDIFLNYILAEGNASGEYYFYIDDVKESKSRTTAADLINYIPFKHMRISDGTNLKLKVMHYETTSCDFGVTLNYHM